MEYSPLLGYSIVIFIGILLISFLSLLILNRRAIKSMFCEIDRKTWAILLVIFILAVTVRMSFPHVHEMYIDEPWYMEMASNTLEMGQPVICYHENSERCWMPFKAPVWPFMLSLLFLFTGASSYAALFFSSFIGSLSIILIFSVSYLLFKNKDGALISALILSIIPLHIKWSNSAETNNLSVFFILLLLMTFLIFVKNKSILSFLLLIVVSLLTFLTRFENVFLILILGLFFLLNDRRPIIKGFVPISLSIIFTGAVIFMLHKIILPSFGRGFPSIDFFYFIFTRMIFDSTFYLILFLFAIIAIFMYKKEKGYNTAVWLFSSFILAIIINAPIAFESRMALMPMIFIIILSSYSVAKLRYRYIAIALIILLMAFALSDLYINQSHSPKMFETITSSIIADNYDGYIISAFPSVITSISDMKGIPTRYAVDNEEKINDLSDVYFFHDIFCAFPDDLLELQEYCIEAHQNFNLTVVEEFRYSNTVFYLYKVN